MALSASSLLKMPHLTRCVLLHITNGFAAVSKFRKQDRLDELQKPHLRFRSALEGCRFVLHARSATCRWNSGRSRQYADARCPSPCAAGTQRGRPATAPSWPARAQAGAPRPCEH